MIKSTKMTTITPQLIEESLKTNETIFEAAKKYSKDITENKYDLLNFIENLGFALTSTDIGVRLNGTKLFSATLAELPQDYLDDKQLDVVITFYINRLKDNHNIIPAIIDGMTAVIKMKNLPNKSITKFLSNFFQNTTCQSQLRTDRAKLFAILNYITEHNEDELKAMSGDFIYGLINSIDGERDPRNLDYIFTFMPGVISRYPLLHLSEEMFEIFACYFPIDLNASKNDPDSITRDTLALKLVKCLTASPEFIEFAITLALEKLDSDLIVAKLDSLDLIKESAFKFPPKLLEIYFDRIWIALKGEIFPGTDNVDINNAGLRALSAILECAANEKNTDLSHNYQTIILGTILPQLDDLKQRLFNPAISIALVCIASDPKFAANKILGTFLLKLQAEYAEFKLTNDDRIRIYGNIAQIFKLISTRSALLLIKHDAPEIFDDIHSKAITQLSAFNTDGHKSPSELLQSTLQVLYESAPVINIKNRDRLYCVLIQLLTNQTLEIDIKQLLEKFARLNAGELKKEFIDICLNNFASYDNNVKRKTLNNLLPLIKQNDFKILVFNLIHDNIFNIDITTDVRVIAIKTLNQLLTQENRKYIEELQYESNLIDKLFQLAKNTELTIETDVLHELALTITLIIKELSISEQYAIVEEYLPQLNLQLEADLYVAKGLLSFLHADISLDDHFESLLNDLTNLSLQTSNELLRNISNNLLCSLINKIDDKNINNRNHMLKLIAKLKEEIAKENKLAISVLSWIAKGLIMRSSSDADDIIQALTDLLEHPSLANAAILAFDIINTEYPQLHLPIVKLLFKQRFFQTILKKFNNGLKTFSAHHLNAFVFVMQATPHKVLQMNIEQLGPIIFKCLESKNVPTISIALHICQNFVHEKDDYFRSHLVHLIPSAIVLITFEKSMNVRVKALELLDDIAKYPTLVLLPYKVDVILDITPALDDHKRLVRNAAVKTSNSWHLVGTASIE